MANEVLLCKLDRFPVHFRITVLFEMVNILKRLFALCLLLACMMANCSVFASEALERKWFGPFFSDAELTLAPGHRTEALGPLFYFEHKDTQKQWGFPPFGSYTSDLSVDYSEFDFAYPLLTYDQFGKEYRFQVMQLFSFAGGGSQDDSSTRRFTLFPLYFQQRSPDPAKNYTALLPFYGHLKNRLFRDEINFVLLPLYLKSRKKDVITDNYLFPFFHLRHGNELSGWQFWPVTGYEHKGITYTTNSLDEQELIGGHTDFFAGWPFYLYSSSGEGSTNPVVQRALLPLYSSYRSPLRDSTTYFWPFGLTLTDDREKKYHEIGAPWPLIDYAYGPGKSTYRLWPLFSESHNANLESDFYLWPLYKYNRIGFDPYERERTRIMFFLYSDTITRNMENREKIQRTDLWPLFTAKKELNGDEKFQLLAPLEPLLPNNKSVERDYSPIWSVWHSERNFKSGRKAQSLLWNLYRYEESTNQMDASFLFGAFSFHSQSQTNKARWKLLYIPFTTQKNASRTNASE
ncbi:MAG: hypothetical protein JWM04_674 [Verrucomicrobiales bacterium]|nr:hypothetical protein [Verrucomicrobiales bacterium]